MTDRLRVVLLFSLLLALIGLSRAAYIQIVGDPRLNQLSKKQFNSKVLVSARRGVISDRNGEPLAVNTDIHSLAANPNKIQNKRLMARLLAKATNIPESKLLEKFKEKKEFVWIKRLIPDDQIDQFKKWGLTDSGGNLIPGFFLVKENFRRYPHGELAAQVVGSVNLDSEGTEGVELWQNSRLEGKVVSMKATRDALGRPTLYDASAANDARDGETIQLTIDASLQFSVEESLRNAVEKTHSRAGTVIVMDASSGEILALANSPNFNPNQRNAPHDVKRNRALTDAYEPGSVMKPIHLATALQNGWKITDRLHGENGSFKVQGKRISEAETHEKFEWISLKKMIEVSSNIVAAKMAMKLGYEKLSQGLKLFEFGTKTGTRFPGELSGWLPSSKRDWTPLTLANVGFGQGLMVTPVQIIRAYAAFANGGYLVTPRILKNDSDDKTPPAPKRILRPDVVTHVVDALKGATIEKEGTGKKAALDGYIVGGKTGTAQTVDPVTRHYSRNHYRSTFVGFPIGTEHKIVILTLLDEPKGVYYAGETAAPLFSEVLNSVVTRFAIPHQVPPTGQTPAKLAEAPAQKAPGNLSDGIRKSLDRLKWSASHTESAPRLEVYSSSAEGKAFWKMPNLHEMTAREALNALKGHDFKVEISGSGLIETQIPAPDSKIGEGDSIRLRLNDQLE